MKDLFSTDDSCDIINSSIFDEEDTTDMANYHLFTYLDVQTARNLYHYLYGLQFNETKNYIDNIPLQLPIKMYEYPNIAKKMAIQSNIQLVAFNIITTREVVYDVFDIGLMQKYKENRLSLDTHKNKFVLARELKKYNNSNQHLYIEYTVFNKKIIKGVKLIDD